MLLRHVLEIDVCPYRLWLQSFKARNEHVVRAIEALVALGNQVVLLIGGNLVEEIARMLCERKILVSSTVTEWDMAIGKVTLGDKVLGITGPDPEHERPNQ